MKRYQKGPKSTPNKTSLQICYMIVLNKGGVKGRFDNVKKKTVLVHHHYQYSDRQNHHHGHLREVWDVKCWEIDPSS